MNSWKALAPFWIDPLIIKVYDPEARPVLIVIKPVAELTPILSIASVYSVPPYLSPV